MRETSVKHPALQLAIALMASGTVGAFVLEAGVDPFTAVFWRCAFGSMFLGVWCVAFGYLPDRAVQRRNLGLSVLAGTFLALCWASLFAGFRMTSIATATIVFQIYPFLLVLVGILFLKERANLSQFIWLAIAFMGVALASGVIGKPLIEGSNWLLGAALTFAAASCYVVTTLAVRAVKNQRPELTMLYQAIVGAVLLSFAADFHQHIGIASWGWLIGIGIIHSGVVMVAIYATYPFLPTAVIAVLNFIYPAVAILVDWAIYGHALGPLQWLGVAMITVATLGVNLGWRLTRNAP